MVSVLHGNLLKLHLVRHDKQMCQNPIESSVGYDLCGRHSLHVMDASLRILLRELGHPA
jgi:hypothetical protein